MKVSIDVGESTTWFGNDGITLHVFGNDNKKRGRLQIGKAKVKWFAGKTSKNHKEVRLEDLLDWLQENG